ncbi:MAG: DNA (cytosine-5-)-methyltransferase [Gammaproteobacteria bacterium]|nr:DNA (cytosine-5-)-methyltransferase [Gammaproteobacteria bacterium]
MQDKLSRIQTGRRPRVLDLFSGCGGLSLGFGATGFEMTAAIESNPTAAASYGANFHTHDPLHAVHRDIISTPPSQLVRKLKLGRTAEAFDVIIGGPPCQAFARVGRSKLREIEAHPEAFRHDARATLYAPYLRYVKSCRPVAILMENVPDVMNFGGHNVPEEVCEVLRALGYICAYTLLNAAFYGVPQTRERMFLIAYHRDVATNVSFPKPTHWIDLPTGYEGSRQVALKLLSDGDMFADAYSYVDPPEPTDILSPAVTAKEAIDDLPETVAGLYEAAIDRMFASSGARPKIIGSTATIRRAAEQVMSLFDRETAQFPPSCLDADDSAFAVVDWDAPGRVYAGVTTAGRSAKFTLQAVAASLLQSALGGTPDDEARDPYWTLVSYFNSLRELGGALVLMQDDVNDSLALLAQRRKETQRHPEFIEELTSRRTQAEVRDMLDRLAIRTDAQGALDVVLATNMLSVGVDIPRLGLMLVNGQPKGIAEYIQATSRVGRGDVPGLVVSVLNNAKARDRSHYEGFPTWHATLYRDVEPMSVTPFASRARDRALHAVLVALVRHLVPDMLDRPVLDDAAVDAARELIGDIVRRSSAIDPQETAVQLELERCLDTWETRAPRSYWTRRVGGSLLQDAERAATLRAMGRLPGQAWPTLNNMRSVEASTRFRLAERLRERTQLESSGNGK